MRPFRLSGAICALVLSAGLAEAQSLAALGGPANLPPADFAGQQFVDNRGCVFVRAGYGATITWVPRVNAQRKALCGFPPTFGDGSGGMTVTAAAPQPAAPRAAQTPGAVAQRPAAPQPQAEPRPRSRHGSLLALLFGPPQPVTTAPAPQPAPQVTIAPVPVPVPVPVSSSPPPGYKLAWKDDRLNPLRGVGTALGQAQQDLVWTRQVPARLAVARPARTPAPPGVTVSTMSAPAALGQQAAPRVAPPSPPPVAPPVAPPVGLVQVGAFGEPANAERAKSRLAALGLPVSVAKTTSKGKVLQIVYAGPFGSADQARAALAQARTSGFSDAILK